MIWLAFLLAQNLTDPELLPRGEKIFARYCSVGYCHGVAGAAGRGPRLRGRELNKSYVYQVTLDGIANSGMPGWKGRLPDQDISAVVAYVMSLSSSTPSAPPPVVMPAGVGPAALVEFSGPEEIRRGYDLFFDATRGTRCSTCHTASGRGIPIGPDLKSLTSSDPAELMSLIRSERSKHVLLASLKNGETFPVLRVEQNEKWMKLYDLASPLPVLRTLGRSQIDSIVQTDDWAHQSVVGDYDEGELKAILLYLRWLSSTEE